MRILSTYHQPSSVIASVHCSLTGSDGSEVSHLVVARPNRVDVHAATPAGLSWRAGIDIWGIVVDVKASRSKVKLESFERFTAAHQLD
jgi:DNA damage-binding protein 1